MINILGLELNKYGHVTDKYNLALMQALGRIADNIMYSAGINPEDEIAKGEKEYVVTILPREETYFRALQVLIQYYPVFMSQLERLVNERKRYAKWKNRKGKKPEGKQWSVANKNKIALYYWELMGNKIPIIDLSDVKVKKALNENRYTFRRKKGEMGWYFNGYYIGKSWKEVFPHFERTFNLKDRKLFI